MTNILLYFANVNIIAFDGSYTYQDHTRKPFSLASNLIHSDINDKLIRLDPSGQNKQRHVPNTNSTVLRFQYLSDFGSNVTGNRRNVHTNQTTRRRHLYRRNLLSLSSLQSESSTSPYPTSSTTYAQIAQLGNANTEEVVFNKTMSTIDDNNGIMTIKKSAEDEKRYSKIKPITNDPPTYESVSILNIQYFHFILLRRM